MSVNKIAQTVKKQLQRLLAVSTITLFSVLAVQITSAYAVHLSLPSAPVLGTAEVQIVQHFVLTKQVTSATLPSFSVGRLLQRMKDDRRRILWSAYPASVRGQVLSRTIGGGDPLATGGW